MLKYIYVSVHSICTSSLSSARLLLLPIMIIEYAQWQLVLQSSVTCPCTNLFVTEDIKWSISANDKLYLENYYYLVYAEKEVKLAKIPLGGD